MAPKVWGGSVSAISTVLNRDLRFENIPQLGRRAKAASTARREPPSRQRFCGDCCAGTKAISVAAGKRLRSRFSPGGRDFLGFRDV